MTDDLARALQAVGLSRYEARVYLSLVRHGLQNGHEVSKTAKVPSSKVYGVLSKLADEGVVHVVRRGGTNRFMPIAPDELIQRLRRRYSEPLEELEEGLPRIVGPTPSHEVLSLSGVQAVAEAARALVEQAEHELVGSLWDVDALEIADALRAAHARGVRIYGMLYSSDGPLELPGSWLPHSYQDIVAGRVHGRMLTVVVDREETLVVHLPEDGVPVGVRTRSPALVLITQEYLHHDRVLQSAQQKIGFAQWDRWWQADADLRSIILGESLDADREA